MLHKRRKLTRYAWLSIATALLTIGLKAAAYLMTGSVGLLSDAMESGVNLIAAIFALVTLIIAYQPPDEEHAYGHAKAEYFACGAEGTLILLAAVSISYSAIRRLIDPQPLAQLELGLAVSVVAALCNLAVSQVLRKAGRQYDSVTLLADAQHLLTDVWTSGGVVVGVAAVAVTGWNVLDPLIALAVAGQIIYSGFRLVHGAVLGLMDTALPEAELKRIVAVLEHYKNRKGIMYHALRTRQSGSLRFVSVHVQVPGMWTVQEGHMLMEEIERDLRKEVPSMSVFTHLEPAEDPVSWQDIQLSREDN